MWRVQWSKTLFRNVPLSLIALHLHPPKKVALRNGSNFNSFSIQHQTIYKSSDSEVSAWKYRSTNAQRLYWQKTYCLKLSHWNDPQFAALRQNAAIKVNVQVHTRRGAGTSQKLPRSVKTRHRGKECRRLFFTSMRLCAHSAEALHTLPVWIGGEAGKSLNPDSTFHYSTPATHCTIQFQQSYSSYSFSYQSHESHYAFRT